MKLKLDLHPIFGNGGKIEDALQSIIDEACEKRAAEIEIIPGKGSGALKKSVLRFLDRSDIKSRYHRIEKDSENWGRLFVHFRWEHGQNPRRNSPPKNTISSVAPSACFCCGAMLDLPAAFNELSHSATVYNVACPSCASPNRVFLWLDRQESVHSRVESGY